MTETTLTQTPIPVHGRRRAAASPFDEIARTGRDGQPYWSARDLAKLFGYDRWSNFADCIRRARQQVESHIVAGQINSADVGNNSEGHFVNVQVASRVGFGDRMIPDVHLTRFAAYFVALNADQSKPEVKAAVNYYFVGRTIQAETMVAAGAADPALTAQTAERLAAMEATLAGLPEVFADVLRDALEKERKPEPGSYEHLMGTLEGMMPTAVTAGAAPRFAGTEGETIPDDYVSASAMRRSLTGTPGAKGEASLNDLLVRRGLVHRRLISKSVGGNAVYGYTVAAAGRGLVVAGTNGGGVKGRPGFRRPARAQEEGKHLYLSPDGQAWARRAVVRDD